MLKKQFNKKYQWNETWPFEKIKKIYQTFINTRNKVERMEGQIPKTKRETLQPTPQK